MDALRRRLKGGTRSYTTPLGFDRQIPLLAIAAEHHRSRRHYGPDGRRHTVVRRSFHLHSSARAEEARRGRSAMLVHTGCRVELLE